MYNNTNTLYPLAYYQVLLQHLNTWLTRVHRTTGGTNLLREIYHLFDIQIQANKSIQRYTPIKITGKKPINIIMDV